MKYFGEFLTEILGIEVGMSEEDLVKMVAKNLATITDVHEWNRFYKDLEERYGRLKAARVYMLARHDGKNVWEPAIKYGTYSRVPSYEKEVELQGKIHTITPDTFRFFMYSLPHLHYDEHGYPIDPEKRTIFLNFLAKLQDLQKHGHDITPMFVNFLESGSNSLSYKQAKQFLELFTEHGIHIKLTDKELKEIYLDLSEVE